MSFTEANAQITSPVVGGLNLLCHDPSHIFPSLSDVRFFSPLTATSYVHQSSLDEGNELRWLQGVDATLFVHQPSLEEGNELRWLQGVDDSAVELPFEERSSSPVLTLGTEESSGDSTLFANINGIDTSGIEHYHPLNLKPKVKPCMSTNVDRAIKQIKSMGLSRHVEPLLMHGAPSLLDVTDGSTNGKDKNGRSVSCYAVEKVPMTNMKPDIVLEQFEENESTVVMADPIPQKRKRVEGTRKPQKRFTANLLYNRFGQLYSNNGGPLAREMMNKVLVENQHFTNHANETPLTTNVARQVEALDPVTLEQRYLFESCSDAARRMNINRTKMSRTCRSGGGQLGANPALVYRYVEFSALTEPQDQEHRAVWESIPQDLVVAGLSPMVVSSEEDRHGSKCSSLF